MFCFHVMAKSPRVHEDLEEAAHPNLLSKNTVLTRNCALCFHFFIQVHVGWGGQEGAPPPQPVFNPYVATLALRTAARKDVVVTMSLAPGVCINKGSGGGECVLTCACVCLQVCTCSAHPCVGMCVQECLFVHVLTCACVCNCVCEYASACVCVC